MKTWLYEIEWSNDYKTYTLAKGIEDLSPFLKKEFAGQSEVLRITRLEITWMPGALKEIFDVNKDYYGKQESTDQVVIIHIIDSKRNE